MKNIVYFLACLLWLAPNGFSQNPFPDAPPEVEAALRERVTQYYSLFQQGRFREAEKFVTEDSRDAYYVMNKARNMGFEIKNITFTSDVKTAEVLVAVKMLMPMMGKDPVPIPVITRWKWIEGDWYIYFPQYKPGDIVETPFGPKKIRPQSNSGSVLPPPSERPTARSLRNMYEVSEKTLRFPSSSAEPVTRSVLVKNESKGRISVKHIGQKLDGVQIAIEPAEAQPEEEITISFTYLPAQSQLSRKYRSRFLVSPLSQRFWVELIFEPSEVQYEPIAGKAYWEDVRITDQGRQTLDVRELQPGQVYRFEAVARSLEGAEGKLFLAAHDGRGRNGISDGPRDVPEGASELFAIDFTATETGKAVVEFGYTGGPGAAHWSKLKITPRTVANPPVLNAGFERGFLEPWQAWGGVRGELSSEKARSGIGSVKLSGSGGVVFQDVSEVTPGRLYEITAWALSAPETKGFASLDVHDTEKRSADFSVKKKVSDSHFEQLRIDFRGTETGKVRVNLAYSGGPGSVYFDDVTVREKSVANGGFENESVAPWNTYGSAKAAKNSEVASSGAHSLALSRKKGGVSQTLEGLRPGVQYQVIAWARAAPGTKGKALLEAEGDQPSGRDGPRSLSESIFRPFSVRFPADQNGKATIHLKYTGGKGVIYWDDVTLTGPK